MYTGNRSSKLNKSNVGSGKSRFRRIEKANERSTARKGRKRRKTKKKKRKKRKRERVPIFDTSVVVKPPFPYLPAISTSIPGIVPIVEGFSLYERPNGDAPSSNSQRSESIAKTGARLRKTNDTSIFALQEEN